MNLSHFTPAPIRTKSSANPAHWNLEELQNQTILAAYEAFKDNKTRMASELGISAASLYRKLDKLKPRLPEKP